MIEHAPQEQIDALARTVPEWFAEAKLGVLISFGHSASRGWELSWQMTGGVEGMWPPRDAVPCEEYFDNARSFDPSGFDAEQWAEDLADAGATYVVVITKHHDGFAFFDTQENDYSIIHTPFGRDLLAELLPALRRRGLRVGAYFSIVDWHHEDYPRITDTTVTKPYELGSWVRTAPEQWAGFRRFLVAQLTEVLTRYGTIDLVWFDGEFEHTPDEWDYAGLLALVRTLQPDAVVNNRLGGIGDYQTPEQQLTDELGDDRRPWEMCMTMNDTWGWTDYDQNWKSVPAIIARYVETITLGGRLLLNVGPDGNGRFTVESRDRLRALGGWIRRNAPASGAVTPWRHAHTSTLPVAIRTMGDGTTELYCYLVMRPYDEITLRDLPVYRLRSVRLVETGADLDHFASARLVDIWAKVPDALGDVVVHTAGHLDDAVVPVVVLRFDGEVRPPAT